MLDKVKSLVPHVIAVFLFIVISNVYNYPLLEGKKIKQHDILMARGMSKEISDFRTKTGTEPLWTNSTFGGMPAYQISVLYKNNIAQFLNKVLNFGMGIPANYMFISLFGFYILLLVFKLDPWLSFAGALAFGFSAYFFIIESAGHNSKTHALALMAPVIAGFILTFRGRILAGGALTALFLALQINANHPQITYYTFLIILILGIAEFTMALKNKTMITYFKALAVLGVAIVISVGTNFTSLYLTYEYGKYSTRGQSELTSHSDDQTSGLDKSYILNDYSYGIAETFGLYIPNFVGAGASEVGTNSATYKFLQTQNYPQARTFIKQLPLYWGSQRYTAGPVYLGAVVIFLFVLGLFVVRGAIKWWLVSATLLSILLAWGKNFEFFSNFFIDYFPAYNKFRTVSMILVIAQFTVPLLGFLGLWKMFGEEIPADKKLKALRNATLITGGFALIFLILPGMFLNFTASYDSQMGWPEQLIDALRQDRESILKTDAFRSLVFVLLSAGVIWGYLKSKLTLKVACIAFSVLVLADLGTVGQRYLSEKNYTSSREAKEPFIASKADQFILEDKTLDYRVINLATDPFNDASTSWFHKSVGGYHGAKLKRYQELIENYLAPETQKIIKIFNQSPTPERIDSLFSHLPAMQMLNTKYIIYNPESPALVNQHVLGNAWFVKSYKWVQNADEEIKLLGETDPGQQALIDQRFKTLVTDAPLKTDSTSVIQLTSYQPNKLIYTTSAATDQMAIFSEIYYDKGWNAYVDGKLTPHFRANYILRGMSVPAGKHTIEFRFEPSSYNVGEKVSLASSILLVLLVLGVLGFGVYKMKK